MFVFQIVANLGLYGPGVLLIREAMVRWQKGWGSVLLLGAAYGILEEGIALSTLFNSSADPVGQLGFYGHWLGVNWVWMAGILPVHMIFSISLPILLLGLALPGTRGRSLLSRRGIRVVYVILGVDVSVLFLFILRAESFWMGWPIFISSFAAIGFLVLVAYRVPAGILSARSDEPRLGPRRMAIVGALFYPAVLVTEFFGIGVSVPAGVDFVLVIALQGLFLVYVVRVMGSRHNERNLLAFALGLILPIAVFGVLAEIRLPLTLLADLVMVLFFRKLWRKFPSRGLQGFLCL